jgi:hypothetical protein
MAAKKRAKRKTQNIPESQRNTEQVKVRLDPYTAARLRALAAHWEMTMGEIVKVGLISLIGKGDEEDEDE